MWGSDTDIIFWVTSEAVIYIPAYFFLEKFQVRIKNDERKHLTNWKHKKVVMMS